MFKKIQVDVLGARQLVAKDLNRLSNPYCKVGLASEGSHGFVGEPVKSKTSFLTLKPRWSGVVFTTEAESPSIRIEVWHKNHSNSVDLFEGYATLTLKSTAHQHEDMWLRLLPRDANDVVGGEVWVLVTLLPSSKLHPALVENREQRMVRVFLSSTFRDMFAEREEIVRKVLIELDKFCYDRGVSLTYIDMRWGITDEMGKNMQTIVSCLREVDSSRPYFVGTIAERYGWHQEKDGADVTLTKTFEAAEVFPEFGWINEYRTRSVTELEVRHGYLLNSCLPEGHVFFYFRDRAYINQIPQNQLSDHLETSQYAIDRLNALKDEIREGHKRGTCHLADYTDAVHLGKMMLEDLKKAVERDFPLHGVDSWGSLAQTRAEHENYARQLCVSYVPVSDYTQQLDSFVDQDSSGRDNAATQGYMVVLGRSGSGKSSLMANWWLSLNKTRQQSKANLQSAAQSVQAARPHPQPSQQPAEKPVFVHFVGASALASSFFLMIIRLFDEINALLGPDDEIQVPKEDGIIEAIPRFLEAISLKGGMIIIFDAVNQLPKTYHALHWLPKSLPPSIFVIISIIPEEEVRQVLVDRGDSMNQLEILPLEHEEKKQLVECKLSKYGKKLAPENMNRLISHPISINPLFLTTVLSELCIIGHYAAFQSQLNIFLGCEGMPSLFQRILERWEDLCDKEIVKLALLLLLGSRYGATEKSILIISQASPAALSPLMSAMKRMLVLYLGNLNFGHSYLRQAVENKYSPEDLIEAQQKLAAYLRTQIFDEHVANELPWLLMRILKSPHCKDQEAVQSELAEVLLDYNRFLIFNKQESLKYELINHWANLKEADPKWTLGPLYSQRALVYIESINEKIKSADVATVPAIKYETAATLLAVSQTLRLSSAQSDARTIGEYALGVFLQISSPDPIIVESSLNVEAILKDEERLNAAIKLHETVPPTKTGFNPNLTSVLFNLADVLRNLGKLELAGLCYNHTLNMRIKLFGEHNADVATSLHMVGAICRQTGKLDEAGAYYDRSLAIRESLFGEVHLQVAAMLNDIGILQCAQKKLEDGKKTHLRALDIRTRLVGSRHPNVANSWNNLGTIYRDMGDLEEGMRCYENALSIRRESFGEVHPHPAFTLTNMGILLLRKGDLDGALDCHKKALAIRTELFGEKHPDVVGAMENIGEVLKKQGKEQEGIEIINKAKAIKASLK